MEIHASKQAIETALEVVNRAYDSNVMFNRFDAANAKDNKYNVTLRVVSSRGKGARMNHDWSRHLVAACWHVHGDFFDALPDGTKVVSHWGSQGKQVTFTVAQSRDSGTHYKSGYWQDQQVGSVMQPAMMSELCEC